MEEKKKIRLEYLKKRSELSSEYRNKADALLFEKTVNSAGFKSSKIILAYYPIKNEPDILPIVRHALACGKRVAFPVCHTDTYDLTFKFIEELSWLDAGAYSIPEPKDDCEIYYKEEKAFCIVPALVFDRNGYRIGYGKGFYDRFLSDFCGISAGLCYDDFLCDVLPKESTDKNVDMIITDKEVLYV